MSAQPENTLVCPRCNKPLPEGWPEGWRPREGSCYFEEIDTAENTDQAIDGDYSDYDEEQTPLQIDFVSVHYRETL